ncbi:MAG: hypothetical protein ACYDGR_02265 [Candidatus Dormibacteria bacterium]
MSPRHAPWKEVPKMHPYSAEYFARERMAQRQAIAARRRLNTDTGMFRYLVGIGMVRAGRALVHAGHVTACGGSAQHAAVA